MSKLILNIMIGLFIGWALFMTMGCGQLPQGLQGQPGAPGLSVVSTSFPASASQCTNGGTVVVFGQDVNGSGVYSTNDTNQTEIVVCNGLNGQNGSDAESVSAVQLCSRQGNPSYGNFPEVGFCIQGQLYGLFEDSKGNLSNSPLSNGTYNDASNNQTCSFTVNGCSVTQL